MPCSAADATRFTATAPHLYSRPASFRSKAATARPPPPQNSAGAPPPNRGPPGGNGAPPSETPAEKVARLRAAHAAKRAAEISTWDRVVIRGRAIADTAHRLTVMGLVGFSVLAAGVTVYSFIDLSSYQRRKKREWLEGQYAELQKQLAEARRAELQGTATDDQMLLLNRERVAEQAKAERENRPGLGTQIKNLFSTSDLKSEENADESKLVGGSATSSTSPAASFDSSVPFTTPASTQSNGAVPASGPVMTAIQEHRRQSERAMEAAGASGGSLDQMAAHAAEQTKKNASSWSSWLGFGSGSK